MNKFYGKIGYVETVDQGNGNWVERTSERNYYGDVIRDNRRLDGAQQLNDNFALSNQFSIIADSYSYEHLIYIRYIEYMGVKWEVTSVDPSNRPRLLISVGGVYNAPPEEVE